MTFKEMGGYVLLALGLLLLAVLGGMVYTGTYLVPKWPQNVRETVLIVPAVGMVWAVMLRGS